MYRKDTKVNFMVLNENASLSDFDNLNDLLTRLAASVGNAKEIRTLFSSKSCHIFITAFRAFLELGYEDADYGKFLEWFINGGSETAINGNSWMMLDEIKATRDAATVHGKIDYVVALFGKYFEEIRTAA